MAYKFSDPAPYRWKNGDILLGLDYAGNETGLTLERHLVTVGGSRAGKGAALLVPNAYRWPHNLLMIDPKGENAELTWQARENMGQNVAIIDPFGAVKWAGEAGGSVPQRLRASFNPLAEIDIEADSARAELMAIGNGLVVLHNKDHSEWIEGGRKLIAGACAFVIATSTPDQWTFASVRNLLMRPDDDLEEIARDMMQDDRAGGLMVAAGNTIITALTSSKGKAKDVLNIARDSTDWLDDAPIKRALGSSSFRLSDLKRGKLSLYLVLPAGGDHMTTYAGFLRLFVKAALHAMDKGGQDGARCLFILDEFFSLGKLEELAEASGRMPSYGVHLWPFAQNLGQIHELYGPKVAETFFANADADIFLGNKDPFTLEYMSKRVGEMKLADIDAPPPKKDSFDPVPFEEKAALYWSGKPLEGAAAEKHRTKQKSAASAHEAQQRGHMSAIDANYTNALGEYNHKMSERGQRRLSADELAQLVGKRQGEAVARSMLAFLSGGDVLHLRLSPYFKPEGIAPTVPLPERIQHLEARQQIGPWQQFGRYLVAVAKVMLANHRTRAAARRARSAALRAKAEAAQQRQKESTAAFLAMARKIQKFEKIEKHYEWEDDWSNAHGSTELELLLRELKADTKGEFESFLMERQPSSELTASKIISTIEDLKYLCYARERFNYCWTQAWQDLGCGPKYDKWEAENSLIGKVESMFNSLDSDIAVMRKTYGLYQLFRDEQKKQLKSEKNNIALH